MLNTPQSTDSISTTIPQVREREPSKNTRYIFHIVNMINDFRKSNGDHLDQNGHTAMQNGSGENPTKFTLKDTPVENQRPMRVVIIGAGFSGIYSTIR